MPTSVGSVHVEFLVQCCVLRAYRSTGYWASSFPVILVIPQLGGMYAPLSFTIGGNESTLGHGVLLCILKCVVVKSGRVKSQYSLSEYTTAKAVNNYQRGFG